MARVVTGNLGAFLSMIAVAEGTSIIPNSDDGYRVVVGGTLFHSYHDHPRHRVYIDSIHKHSTAAGRYQILERYYDHYKKELQLPDFSPESQDKIAAQMIRECRALDDIEAGRLEEAIFKCCSRWASFPGASYDGQPMQKLETLELAYTNAGGTLAG